MSEIWCKNVQAFLRYSNYRVGILYFASPCILLYFKQYVIYLQYNQNNYSIFCTEQTLDT